MAHQTMYSSATIGTFNAIASHTIPQALPLMRGSYPGSEPINSVVLSDEAGSTGRLTTRRRDRHTVAPGEMESTHMETNA